MFRREVVVLFSTTVFMFQIFVMNMKPNDN